MDFLPGVKPYESTIVVEFFPAGDVVRMVVTIYPMHNEEFTRMTIAGFTSQLRKLDRRFGSKAYAAASLGRAATGKKDEAARC